jgi:choline dehydrogenase-like flavoprotein
MMIDGRNVPAGSTVEVDLCIVGGGPAGISLALQFLNRTGTTVALVESGGREWDERTQNLADAESFGHQYFPMKETHLRVLGGSSLSYGGICTELSELDFEERSWVPESGWPIKKQELDSYLPEALQLFEVEDGTEQSAGGDSTEGTTWEKVLFSPPTRFGKRYADDLEKSANITTYLHSTVTNIDLHPDAGHVETVTVKTFAGNSYKIKAQHFVLAGGGIEIPRLMLASNDVATAGVANAHDNVGRYFQEHARATDRYIIPEGTTALTERISGAAGTLRFSRLGISEKAQREEELLNYYVNLNFGFAGQDTPQWWAIRRVVNASRSPWNDSPYYQDIGGGPNAVRWEDVKTSLVKPHRTIQSLFGAALRPNFMRKWVELQSSIEQVPRPENRVALSSEKDELGVPRAELHWTLDDREKRTYFRGRELFLEELDRLEPGLSKNRMDDPEQWPDHIFGTWHHAGATRMHVDPTKGVVDADAKVHGLDNLFVASSSIFPTSGATSPTLTIVCLTLRLTDHLVPLLDG